MESKKDILKFKSKMVRISSEDKTSNSLNNSRFTINLNQTGSNIDKVAGYSIKYISCPNVFYNVPEDLNLLQLTRQTGPVIYNINVEPNQYVISDFITELQNKINAVIGPNSVVITLTSQNKLNFAFSADNWELSYTNSTINNIIGLSPSNDGFFFTVATLANPVNLTGETELYIHSKTLNAAGLVEPDGSFAVVDVIPLNVPYGAVAYSNYNDVDLHKKLYMPYESLRTLRTVDIVLRNRQGRVLVLPDNFYFNMVVIIYYE